MLAKALVDYFRIFVIFRMLGCRYSAIMGMRIVFVWGYYIMKIFILKMILSITYFCLGDLIKDWREHLLICQFFRFFSHQSINCSCPRHLHGMCHIYDGFLSFLTVIFTFYPGFHKSQNGFLFFFGKNLKHLVLIWF